MRGPVGTAGTVSSARVAARTLALLVVVAGGLVLGGASASAHPLGNFTVNHYDGLTLHPDRVDVTAVLDSAELPTAAEKPSIDTNGDGTMSTTELTAFAGVQCHQIAAAVRATVTPQGSPTQALSFAVEASAAVTVAGSANLPTLRVSCELTAPARLSGPATLTYANGFRSDRVGWKEITVAGDGVRAINSPVPDRTTSDELRHYPGNILASPLQVESVTVSTAPGSGSTFSSFATPGGSGDPLTAAVARADGYLQKVVGGTLTPVVGLLAVLLSLLLGAGHAVLPGHGKTVMAAYLAGKRGSRRDALTVGATVTGTHTLGVLVVGTLITVGAQFAGEQLLRWLGVISGLLVAAIGVGLLVSAVRTRRERAAAVQAELVLVGVGGAGGTGAAAPTGHGHGHGHGRGHGHGHGHGRKDPGYTRRGLVGMGIAGGLVPSPSATVVLAGSIALGRTVFGIGLVLAYGLGMAATLTAVGLLLVRVRHRLDTATGTGRVARLGARVDTLTAVLPMITAVLVLVVGLFLATRGILTHYA